MREPPKLADATIIAALHKEYGLTVATLSFLALGADAASSVYRVQTTDGTAYFVKVRAAGGFSEPSLAIPQYLYSLGVPHVVAPLRTVGQAVWVDLGGFALTLCPFVQGRMAADVGLSAQQWHDFGALMRQVHSCRLPSELLSILPRERFAPKRAGLIADLDAFPGGDSPVGQEFAAFWRSRREVIHTLAERAHSLGEQLRQTSAPLVLCHADMHTWNLLADSAQQFWLVDWDETVLALKERDLMFVVGGLGGDGVGPKETALFLEGYGDTVIDPVALAYYRYTWAVQDIVEFGDSICFRDLSEGSRREALRFFKGLFSPSGIVSLALSS